MRLDRLILYAPGVLFTPVVANAKGMKPLTIKAAVDGELIDFDAINRKIGSLGDAANQARRQKAERTEVLVPEHVAMKWIRNFPNG